MILWMNIHQNLWIPHNVSYVFISFPSINVSRTTELQKCFETQKSNKKVQHILVGRPTTSPMVSIDFRPLIFSIIKCSLATNIPKFTSTKFRKAAWRAQWEVERRRVGKTEFKLIRGNHFTKGTQEQNHPRTYTIKPVIFCYCAFLRQWNAKTVKLSLGRVAFYPISSSHNAFILVLDEKFFSIFEKKNIFITTCISI